MSGTIARTSSVRPVEGNLPTHVRRLDSIAVAQLCFHDVFFQALHERDDLITLLLGNL
jgi:hypothetical protein